MRFAELIEMDLKDGRTDAIRKAFAPYTAPIDVSGYEFNAIIVLINLSHKRAEVRDLLDERLAADTLRDEKHLAQCLQEVNWFHTHNLKHPDVRVSGQRIVAAVQGELVGLISSGTLPKRLGWSHASQLVNKARLFGIDFFWGGRTWNLAELLVAGSAEWEQPLRKLGLKLKVLREWREQISSLLPGVAVPGSVHRYSQQVRFPFRSGYLSITPVISHAMLCEIQRLHRAGKGHFKIISHSRSAAIGDLSASLGGKIAAMNYPPPAWFSCVHTLAQSRSRKMATGGELFDTRVIYDRDFLGALRRLVEVDRLPTLRQRRSTKVAALRIIRLKLAAWLAPVVEWCESNESEVGNCSRSDKSLEQRLASTELKQWHNFNRDLNHRLHLQLQQAQVANRFAYHPKLLASLSGQIKSIIGALSKGFDNSDKGDSGAVFLHLESIRVFDAQALSNPYLVGVPSLTALWGLIHSYERKVRKLSAEELQFTGVSWFLRSYSSSDGRRLPEPTVLKSRSQNVSRPSIIDMKRCDLVMDVVIRVSVSDTSTFVEQVGSTLKAALPSAFAGGDLHPPSLYELRDWVQIYVSPEKLFGKLARLPRNGCWIFPVASNCTSLDTLLEKVESLPTLKPAMLGFQFLEEPCAKSGSIEPLHAFAEPVLGLVQCLSPIEIRMRGPDYFYRNGFWSMESQEHAMLIKKA